MKLPFKGNFRISQGFGQNFNNYYRDEGLKGHQGIDFATPIGTPIIAPCDGIVIFISTDIRRGLGVTVMSDEIFKYNNQDCRLSCVHWHLKEDSIVVKVGQKVKEGELLGLSGNTGQTTGPHLHFSVSPLSADGSRRELALGNGYKGCIDATPYLEFPDLTLKFKELQELLNKWGAKLVVDGVFGKLSKQALTDFLG